MAELQHGVPGDVLSPHVTIGVKEDVLVGEEAGQP